MKTKHLAICLSLCLCVFIGQMCTFNKKPVYESDPIVASGHGALIGPDGKEVVLEESQIEAAQEYFIDKLLKSEWKKDRRTEDLIKNSKRDIYDLVDDKILANALFLDELIDKIKPASANLLLSISNGLKRRYVNDIRKENNVLNNTTRWYGGIKPEIIKKLNDRGITVKMITVKSGEEYCRECIAAGVPIPKNMYGPEWRNLGEISEEFISESSRAELLIYESTNPKGVCLALPRYAAGTDNATLFGVICLGTETGKVCFFDNNNLKKDEVVDFKRWRGGASLVGGDVCTDCHAGENPYVVHPEKSAFAGILGRIKSPVWYDPIVAASWPQNPGPSNILDGVPSPGRCNTCHVAGSAGRFPDVSVQLSGYCSAVLKNAIGEPNAYKRTMPMGGGSLSAYLAHIDALKNACGGPPTGGGVIVDNTTQKDPSFISPPIVIDPLYQCATAVSVRGVILGATVKLFVNNVPVGIVTNARNPVKTDFTGLNPLSVGDAVTATQEVGGVVSSPSAMVKVRDYKVDFPAGLPPPVIDPALVYECAEVISVRHVPGATVTVFTNGGFPVSFVGSTDWTLIRPGKAPFNVGDKFTAQISLCTDKSPVSGAAVAVSAPATLPTPVFNPVFTYKDQELVSLSSLANGALTTVTVSGTANVKFTTSVSWYSNLDIATKIGRKLQAGDALTAVQKLCNIKSGPGGTRPTQDCASLPAPVIQHPLVGNDFVVVSSAVPGARIMVYDASGKEIGDGSGTIVKLSRKITGNDVITVVQQVGECTSSKGYRVSVRNNGVNTLAKK
ncbi:hypothetical protein GVN16_24715 [Emticicia sp. CRIBPO]|uniref:hypothetical protein n=1 Tax=Emticicia sp. CRIBPO TaxID=2683258 RepID=UPI001412724B|nr:hypothetical protein [Emticicia sp. CRIBPO]NBA89002.1 hypothetical protein [Emticicia sp. CRIBPO]